MTTHSPWKRALVVRGLGAAAVLGAAEPGAVEVGVAVRPMDLPELTARAVPAGEWLGPLRVPGYTLHELAISEGVRVRLEDGRVYAVDVPVLILLPDEPRELDADLRELVEEGRGLAAADLPAWRDRLVRRLPGGPAAQPAVAAGRVAYEKSLGAAVDGGRDAGAAGGLQP